MAETNEEDAKFLALLQEVHQFPMAYDVRVICLAEVASELPRRVVEATALALVGEPATRASAAGKYVRVELKLLVQEARDVVRAYAVIRAFEGVKMFF